MHAFVDVDILLEFFQRVGAEAGGNRPGLDQAHENGAAVGFVAQGVGEAFEGEFGAVVRAAPGHGGKAQNAAVYQHAPAALAAEDFHGVGDAFPSAEHIGVELLVQGNARNIFHRAHLAVAGVAEERIEPAAGLRENMGKCGFDLGAVGHIEQERVGEAFALQPRHVFGAPA